MCGGAEVRGCETTSGAAITFARHAPPSRPTFDERWRAHAASQPQPRWRHPDSRTMLAPMSVSLLLAVFITGLVVGVILALAVVVLLRRDQRGAADAATSRLADLLAP